MSAFSERLGDVLERKQWSQTELARRCRTTPGNVSRWCRTKALPDRETLGRLIAVLEENDAVKLLSAWIEDSLPPRAGDLIRIEPQNLSPIIAEETPVGWPAGLSAQTRRKFSDFAKLAMEHPDVMKIVDVLHAAAKRMRRERP